MTTQPEQILEETLVKQLVELGYTYVAIRNQDDLIANLKSQLEIQNNTTFTHKEFERILNHLDKGNVFDRAGILRDKMQLTKDNGENTWIEFIQQEQWCQNQYQVTQQVTMEGSYKNRYDVTLLVNGLPLVQIELKRRGLELKEAFNQTNRYQRHSYWAESGLFQYIQVFVISNGVNTKYYANNSKQSFKQTFFWTDNDNKAITRLEPFTQSFLEPCQISKMICKYIVLHQTRKILMVLRSYQYYAVEALIDRVNTSDKNGYIWHTTGSGKTLTSFKASQLLVRNPKIDKVIFVVDRRDLDDQTYKEFKAFSPGSVDETPNTSMLVKQFSDNNRLILTTIQKLNNTIHHSRYLRRMEKQKEKNIIFIFDECHRSQFGETHKRIKSFFINARMFGFTGTPIFVENAVKNALGKRTTKELFHDCLHKYVITDAIRDENVLKFAVEYIGKYKEKEGSNTEIDIEVEDIDKRELMDSEDRLRKITDYIINNHNRKTHNRDFTAIFCVSSIETLIKYYNLFKERQKEKVNKLKIATIFSYGVNEDDRDADGIYPDDYSAGSRRIPVNSHSRDHLESFIGDYNLMFNTSFSTKDNTRFYDYYKNIAKQLNNRKIDILLVVNMFLTGFDSPTLNTLYVDKNLQYHGLIQAYSRTNRILNEQKSQGNIVCFRNLKKATDEAITLFANKDAKEIIFMEPYEDFIKKFNTAVDVLLAIAPKLDSVDELESETKELEFVKAFRQLMRYKNVLTTFGDFDWEDLDMKEQDFEDYKSKYLDLYDKVKIDTQKEKVSILDDVDFELELIHRDEINVAYILELLAALKDDPVNREDIVKKILELMSGEVKLRSKRELIRKFIDENLMNIPNSDDIPREFETFWDNEKTKALETICREENLSEEKFRKLVSDYLYTSREPLRDDLLGMRLGSQPRIRERKTIAQRLIGKLLGFVETFFNHMDI